MLIKFEVTETDIKTGIKDNCDYCPIAQAIYNKILPGNNCSVLQNEAVFRKGYGLSIHISLPRKALVFIKAFDKGEPVKPFTFELDLPEGLTNA